MFKKVLALTLALVMLLMPMTASAVTWSQITAALNTVGSYDDGTTKATKSEDGTTTTTGGTIDFDHSIAAPGTYIFVDIKGNEIWAYASDGNEIKVVLRGSSQLDSLEGYAEGSGSRISLKNEAAVGTIYAHADENASISVKNAGTAEDVNAGASNGSYAELVNEEAGQITGFMYADATDGSFVQSINQGTVDRRMYTSAYNESSAMVVNSGSADAINFFVSDGSTAELCNKGEVVGGEDGSFIYAEGESKAFLDNQGSMGGLYVTLHDGSELKAKNDGSIDELIVDPYDTSKAVVSGDGDIGSSLLFINVEPNTTYTAEQIVQIMKESGIGDGEVLLYTMDEDGNFTACYAVDEDGTLTLLEAFEEEDEEPEPEPDPVEEQRQAEGIGGVTTSPVWNWQGYLGHSSKPMWIYVNGEKTMMRQRLFWLPDSTKNHTCRINVDAPDPASVELRIGLDMLRTAQRAEISVISILDKEGNTVAQFAVSDLMGAFEQYGLVEGELLCVSGDADAEVMKVTLEGEYLPLEAE